MQSRFLLITEKKYDVILDIKYATENNFTGKKIYNSSKVFLHENAAKKLLIASQYAKNLGYKIKIFDAFRPLDVQQSLYEQINDERYVSNPVTGVATHTRGVAVDLTLVDIHGDELDMGTEFDSFDDRAHQSPDIPNLSQNVLCNRIILAGIMSIAGFTPLSTEWWHYHIRIYDEYLDYTDFPKLKMSDVDGYI